MRITQNHIVEQNGIIPFDQKIEDPNNSFNKNSSTFVAPWSGNFTFIDYGTRDMSHGRRDIYGYRNMIESEKFLVPSTKFLKQGEFIVFYRIHDSVKLGCTPHHPCKLTVSNGFERYTPKTIGKNS